jgi:hypothetical protein
MSKRRKARSGEQAFFGGLYLIGRPAVTVVAGYVARFNSLNRARVLRNIF